MPFEPRHTGARQGRAPFLRFPIGQKELAILRRLKPLESQITPRSAFRRVLSRPAVQSLYLGRLRT
jgi:hypothetical protein